MAGNNLQFWIDRGGTFTDVIARHADGRLETLKLLSDNPAHYGDAALEGIRRICAKAPGAKISAIKMGTTVATNALLERRGEPLVLITTRGFKDALSIAYQNRPKLFDLHIVKPELLHQQVVEVNERLSATGEVLVPLDIETLRAPLQAAFDKGLRAAAILLMHGYKYPEHEKRIAELARDIGFTQVSTSHEVSPLMKFVSRGDTTCVDAYLTPILRRYIDRVEQGLTSHKDARVFFMRSDGGLTSAELFQGKDAILSGPAGGVVGLVKVSELAGFDKVIGFDMGGTSTDVAHYAGDIETTFETEVAGVRMRAPMMSIHTVAAGGGSVLTFDGLRFRVGPESAGADPGPACYLGGGPLTVTDANLMLGRISPDFFPHVFGPEANAPIDRRIVEEKFSSLAKDIGDGRSAEDVAEGFLAIAVQNMAEAIKKISTARGHDVKTYMLTAFGGAGGQHACRVADALGISKVLLHPLAGVLSAYGMGLAGQRASRQQGIERELTPSLLDELAPLIRSLTTETEDELTGQGVAPDTLRHAVKFHLKYKGADTSLPVSEASLTDMSASFERAHQQLFGFISPQTPLIVEAIAIESTAEATSFEEPDLPGTDDTPRPISRLKIYHQSSWIDAPLYDRKQLKPGQTLVGPALIFEDLSTIVIEPEWQGEVTPKNHLILTRATPLKSQAAIGTKVDPVQLEIFNNLFMSIAEQMGVALEKTAQSVNIKERLDFSCAVFDDKGHLVANAPHMPVHLGSMGDSVRSIADQYENAMSPGDVFVLNNPYNGGTHLPDITVVAPVFDDTEQVTFYVAARGHHADIGGITPGSMPAHSHTLEEEGVLLDNLRLVTKGRFEEEAIRACLTSHKYPARNPDQNIADLKAQVAACQKGMQELARMTRHFGRDVVKAYMGHVQDNAEENVRRVIDVLEDNQVSHPMDCGARIEVAIKVDRKSRSATLDFTGTSKTQTNNFNAPASVCRAAVLYVFRCLVADNIPLNAGCLKPLNLVLPEDTLVNPTFPAAVVAGNVETSQALTDALFEACKALAGSQGTMNNLTFGNDTYQYYETIAGGAGAGPGFNGADAVQTHMTNSRLTDPEVLEHRFPVVLETFEIRQGSGGRGQTSGGNGVAREIRFLEEADLSILSSSRTIAPKGMGSGGDGACGENLVRRSGGKIEKLKASDSTHMRPGDTIIIKTPGGGGFGEIKK